jgi:hypothetical protein
MQVTETPESKSHEKVLFPTLTVSPGLILFPLNGTIISQCLLQVVVDIVHRLKLSCGMMLRACLRGAIKLVNEKLAAVPFVKFFHWLCPSHKL